MQNVRVERQRSRLVAAGLGLLGCHGSPEATPSAPSAEPAMLLGAETRAHPVGELGVATDYSMRVESDKECPLEPPFASKRGFVKVGFELSVEGTTSTEVPVNPFYATLYDAGGDSYTSTLAGCEPNLPPVRVTTGKRARGFVTFEIPRGARKLELRYAPLVIGRTSEELRFAINR